MCQLPQPPNGLLGSQQPKTWCGAWFSFCSCERVSPLWNFMWSIVKTCAFALFIGQLLGEALTCDASFYSLATSPNLTHSRLNPDSLATTHFPEVCSRAGFAHPPDSLATTFVPRDHQREVFEVMTCMVRSFCPPHHLTHLRRFTRQSLSCLGEGFLGFGFRV